MPSSFFSEHIFGKRYNIRFVIVQRDGLSSVCSLQHQEESNMNQQEYIDVSDRTKISCALRILEEVYAEQSSILEPSELQHVMAALRAWEEKLLERIRIA